MGSFELATAVRSGIDVTVVVNDSALTAIKGSQLRDCEGRTIDTELTNPDFVAFARSFGIHAEKVSDLGGFRLALDGHGRRRTVPGGSRDERPPGRDHELGHLAAEGPSAGVRSAHQG